MLFMECHLFTLLAQVRFRVFQRLWEGDPIAWTSLVVIVAFVVGWPIVKKRFSGKSTPEDSNTEARKSNHDLPIDRTLIVPRIKNTTFLTALVDAGVPSDQMPFTESLIADLLVTYAFDLPDTFVMATQRHLAELGIDSSSIRNLAIENLKQNMPQIALQKSGAVFRAVTGNNLDACTLLSRNLWSNQAKQMKGDLIASAPTRDIVLFCDSASEDGLREMKRLVQQAFNAGGNHALTQALLRWSENGWQHYQA